MASIRQACNLIWNCFTGNSGKDDDIEQMIYNDRVPVVNGSEDIGVVVSDVPTTCACLLEYTNRPEVTVDHRCQIIQQLEQKIRAMQSQLDALHIRCDRYQSQIVSMNEALKYAEELSRRRLVVTYSPTYRFEEEERLPEQVLQIHSV